MNEPMFSAIKMNKDSRTKSNLQLVAKRVQKHEAANEQEPSKTLNYRMRVLRVLMIFFKKTFNSKSDLTYEKFVRLESKPTRHSDYK